MDCVSAAGHSTFEGLKDGNYRDAAMRILPGKAAPEGQWTFGSVGPWIGSKSSEGLELLMVEWMFGTSEFSLYSDTLHAGASEPYMSMNTKDAERAGVSDGDIVAIELDNGTLEIAVSVSNRTAEGVLVIPRHQSIGWRKMKDFSVWVPAEKIGKTAPA
jgi:hypothetical protein